MAIRMLSRWLDIVDEGLAKIMPYMRGFICKT